MARVNHKKVKQLLNEKRSKITDRQFFTSRILAGHFEDVAAAQTKRYRYNRRVHVNIYWAPKDRNGACTNNTSIRINAGHPSVTKIRGRMNRYEMIQFGMPEPCFCPGSSIIKIIYDIIVRNDLAIN